MFIDFDVGISYCFNSKVFHKLFPIMIIFLPLFGKVLASVYFDNELCFCAVKISDVRANNPLSHDSYRVVAKEVKPQAFFLVGHIFTEFNGVWR